MRNFAQVKSANVPGDHKSKEVLRKLTPAEMRYCSSVMCRFVYAHSGVPLHPMGSMGCPWRSNDAQVGGALRFQGALMCAWAGKWIFRTCRLANLPRCTRVPGAVRRSEIVATRRSDCGSSGLCTPILLRDLTEFYFNFNYLINKEIRIE